MKAIYGKGSFRVQWKNVNDKLHHEYHLAAAKKEWNLVKVEEYIPKTVDQTKSQDQSKSEQQQESINVAVLQNDELASAASSSLMQASPSKSSSDVHVYVPGSLPPLGSLASMQPQISQCPATPNIYKDLMTAIDKGVKPDDYAKIFELETLRGKSLSFLS